MKHRAQLPYTTSIPTEPLEGRCLMSAGLSQPAIPSATLHTSTTPALIQGYMPAQIRSAYGFDQISGSGAGQTIAIVDAYSDPKIISDLATFDGQFGIAAPPKFSIVSQTGGSVTKVPANGAWAGEIALDVEWAHAIAPGANILLVETNSSNIGNLLAGVNYARGVVGVSVVSMSWGGGEFVGESNYDSDFSTPSGHPGVTFVASSGDQGSLNGIEWPAASPNVLSVGGTSLVAKGASGVYSSEQPWVGSTGGFSWFEPEPGYQQVVQSSGVRSVPDVSYAADPKTGFAVYDSVPYQGAFGWQEAGGTSCGAPQWGALIAIADQQRTSAKLAPLDGPSQTLPTLYKPYNSATAYDLDYRDVTTSSVATLGFGKFVTEQGYDTQTGLGTPKALGIIPALEHAANSSGTSSSGPAGSGPVHVVIVPQESADSPEIVVEASNFLPAPPALISFSSAPTVFNDTVIRHDAVAPTLAKADTLLSNLASPKPLAALATANSATWIGQTDAALVSWLTGGTNSIGLSQFIAAKPQAAMTAGHAILAASPAVHAASSAIAPMADAAATVIYRFVNFDPARTFADAIADFAHESAAISPAMATRRQTTHRAWLITGAVLGIDAILAGHWYASRLKEKLKQQLIEKTFATGPQSPQASPLPTGL